MREACSTRALCHFRQGKQLTFDLLNLELTLKIPNVCVKEIFNFIEELQSSCLLSLLKARIF